MRYGDEQRNCTKGCKLPYREDRRQHDYIYHEPKTHALICGCGWGELFVTRMRQHLISRHGIVMEDPDEIVDKYFAWNVVAFTAIRMCNKRKFKGQCYFRSPYPVIVQIHHTCVSDMGYAEEPPLNSFHRLLNNPSQRPRRGYPKDRIPPLPEFRAQQRIRRGLDPEYMPVRDPDQDRQARPSRREQAEQRVMIPAEPQRVRQAQLIDYAPPSRDWAPAQSAARGREQRQVTNRGRGRGGAVSLPQREASSRNRVRGRSLSGERRPSTDEDRRSVAQASVPVTPREQARAENRAQTDRIVIIQSNQSISEVTDQEAADAQAEIDAYDEDEYRLDCDTAERNEPDSDHPSWEEQQDGDSESQSEMDSEEMESHAREESIAHARDDVTTQSPSQSKTTPMDVDSRTQQSTPTEEGSAQQAALDLIRFSSPETEQGEPANDAVVDPLSGRPTTRLELVQAKKTVDPPTKEQLVRALAEGQQKRQVSSETRVSAATTSQPTETVTTTTTAMQFGAVDVRYAPKTETRPTQAQLERAAQAAALGGARPKTSQPSQTKKEDRKRDIPPEKKLDGNVLACYPLDVQVPGAGKYDEHAGLFYSPPNWALSGDLHISADVEGYADAKMRLFICTFIECGQYLVCGYSGTPVAQMTITMHDRNPNRVLVDAEFSQFNPMDYAIFAELLDYRSTPPSLLHYACLSNPLPKGEYRAVRMRPRTHRVVKILITERYPTFGRVAYPKIRKKDNRQ